MKTLILTELLTLAALAATSASGQVAPRPGAGAGPGNLAPSQTLLDDRASRAEFRSLFNGQDLTGWSGEPTLWSVQDGAITGQTTAEHPAKENTFLIWTNGTVSDFELRCQFRIMPGDSHGFANSGIQFRSKILDPSYWVVGGYQADMEAGPNYTGTLYEERMTRGTMANRGEKVVWDKDGHKEVVGSVGDAAAIQASVKKGGWNSYVIIARGNHIQQFINGMMSVDVTDDCVAKRAMSGVLALQLHAGPPMKVQFKRIELKDLSAKATVGGDLEQVQGDWKLASAEANGSKTDPADLPDFKMTIKGTSYTVLNQGQQETGTFSLNPSTTPKQIDVHHTTAQGEQVDLFGIYEISPLDFRVCYSQDASGRPTSFTTSDGSGTMLLNYTRK